MIIKLFERCAVRHRLLSYQLKHVSNQCCKRSLRKEYSTKSQKRSLFGIEWYYIPAGVGFGLICFIQLRHILKRKSQQNSVEEINTNYILNQWQVDVLKNLPTRALSRFWGYCCDSQLPVCLRKPLINSYAKLFNCNIEEAVIDDVKEYETFNKFFTRQLKPGVRNIDNSVTMVSPADCTVLAVGCTSTPKIELEQIKGIKYPIDIFTGPRHPFLKGVDQSFKASQQIPSCSLQEDRNDFQLYYCSLYLGPGDYHWFHSPTEWTVEHRRHVPGHLFSVNPRILRTIEGIFNFNERVLLSGHWENGIFLFGAIGAYNVGSVKLDFRHEQDLHTNKRFINETFKDRVYGTGTLLKRGDTIGRFELGSSIVLVFTAPKDFQFTVSPGQKLKYGEKLGDIIKLNDS